MGVGGIGVGVAVGVGGKGVGVGSDGGVAQLEVTNARKAIIAVAATASFFICCLSFVSAAPVDFPTHGEAESLLRGPPAIADRQAVGCLDLARIVPYAGGKSKEAARQAISKRGGWPVSGLGL